LRTFVHLTSHSSFTCSIFTWMSARPFLISSRSFFVFKIKIISENLYKIKKKHNHTHKHSQNTIQIKQSAWI
jgi:hypothetical protein